MKEKDTLKITLIGIFFLYGTLVATHDGEFWPFSIYPMFSQAGNTWYRALVRDVTDTTFSYEAIYSRDELPGKPFRVHDSNIHQNDLSNYLSKTENWDEAGLKVITSYFVEEKQSQDLLIYNVEGALDGPRTRLRFIPTIYISRDTVFAINENN